MKTRPPTPVNTCQSYRTQHLYQAHQSPWLWALVTLVALMGSMTLAPGAPSSPPLKEDLHVQT